MKIGGQFMQRNILSLTIGSIITLLCAWEANSVTTEVPLQSSHTNSTEIMSQELDNSDYSLADGVYFAKEDHYSNDGWKHLVNFEIINGKIESITFDAINEQATTYKRDLSMKEELDLDIKDKSSLKWHEQVALIENYCLTSKIDIQLLTEDTLASISGVTLNFRPFIQLLNEAITNGPLKSGPYQDGSYYAETEELETQLKHTIHLIIENGYIIAAHWDVIPISDKNNGNTTINNTSIQHEVKQANLLENYLIEIQDPTQMTFNEENKTTDINGVTIEVDQFIELAIKALASGPLLN